MTTSVTSAMTSAMTAVMTAVMTSVTIGAPSPTARRTQMGKYSAHTCMHVRTEHEHAYRAHTRTQRNINTSYFVNVSNSRSTKISRVLLALICSVQLPGLSNDKRLKVSASENQLLLKLNKCRVFDDVSCFVRITYYAQIIVPVLCVSLQNT